MQNVEQSLSSQKSVGFTDKDIDDVRRLISDTSIYLLALTLLASLLHLLFEFLAFQSDITFWRENKSLAGLSTRTVITDLVSQVIIFLFLLESDTSMLVIIPTFFGILIQAWKVQKDTGFGIVRMKNSTFGYSLECSRWKTGGDGNIGDISDSADTRASKDAGTTAQGKINSTAAVTVVAATSDSPSKRKQGNKGETVVKNEAASLNDKAVDGSTAAVTTAVTAADTSSSGISDEELTAVTMAADQMATRYLGLMLLPLALLMSLRSLLLDKHAAWYAWGIGSLTGVVYTFGFVLMCPQLFINHELKAVAALPWKFLIYKFLNTFIDGKSGCSKG